MPVQSTGENSGINTGHGRGNRRGSVSNRRGRGGPWRGVDDRGRRDGTASVSPLVQIGSCATAPNIPNPHSRAQLQLYESDSTSRGLRGMRGAHSGRLRSGFAPVRNQNIGYLPPPPGLPPLPGYSNRWAAIVARDDRGSASGHSHHNSEAYDAVPPGLFGPGRGRGVTDRARGRGWATRGSFRGYSSTPPPPSPLGEPRRNWAQLRERGRGRGFGRGTEYSAQEYPRLSASYRGRGVVRGDVGSRGRGRYDLGDRQPERENFYGRYGRTNAVEDLPPPRDMMEGVLVPALQHLLQPDVAPPDEPISLQNFVCIGSYTWYKQRNPTIVVPGSPPRWRERPFPIQVRFDNGIRMINENGYYMGGASSFIPLFRAVDSITDSRAVEPAPALTTSQEDAHAPEQINWPSVDFVTDRNNLRKFLRWIRSLTPHAASLEVTPASPDPDDTEDNANDAYATSLSENTSSNPTEKPLLEPQWDDRKDFRIDLHLGGEKTVLMERWAPFERERVVPPKGGCRDNFLREAVAHGPDCENGGGHYRIVQYDIGGLRMVVRWEVDSWIPDLEALSPSASTSSVSEPATPSDPSPPPVADSSAPAVIDIDRLACWDNNDSGSRAAAWSVPEPASTQAWDVTPSTVTLKSALEAAPSVANNDLRLAERDDSIDHSTSRDVPTSTMEDASCPIEQVPNANGTDIAAAIAIWDTSADDASASAAAWGDSSPPGAPQKDTASVFADATEGWDVPVNDGASWDVPVNDSASWDVPTNDNASWDVPTNDSASWDIPTNDNASWDVGPSAGDTPAHATELKVIRAGTLLPQSAMLELATRSATFLDRTNIEDTYLQLFLTRSPVNLVAVHNRGSFDRVIRQELDSPELARFNECADIQRSLAQLVALLREIQHIVQARGNTGKLSLVCEKGQLRVHSRVGDEDPLLTGELARFLA